jgi:hypothetical protein
MVNNISAENFMRSATAPTISAGVMMAKVSWNIANTLSGTWAYRLAGVIPANIARSRPPMNECRLVTPACMPSVLNAML